MGGSLEELVGWGGWIGVEKNGLIEVDEWELRMGRLRWMDGSWDWVGWGGWMGVEKNWLVEVR